MKNVVIIFFALTALASSQYRSRSTIAPNIRYEVWNGDSAGVSIPDSIFRGLPCGVLFHDTTHGVWWTRPCGGLDTLAIAFPDSIILALKHGLYRTQAQWVVIDSGCLRIDFRPRTKRWGGAWFERNDTLIIKDTCGAGSGAGVIAIYDTTGKFISDTAVVFRGVGGINVYVQKATATGQASPRDTVYFDHSFWDRIDFVFHGEFCDTLLFGGEGPPGNSPATQIGIVGDGGYICATPIYVVHAPDTLYLERVAIKNIYGQTLGGVTTYFSSDTVIWAQDSLLSIPKDSSIMVWFLPANSTYPPTPPFGAVVPPKGRQCIEVTAMVHNASWGPFPALPASRSLHSFGQYSRFYLPLYYSPAVPETGYIIVTLRFRHKVRLPSG